MLHEGLLCSVSEWMENGNLIEFLSTNNVARLGMPLKWYVETYYWTPDLLYAVAISPDNEHIVSCGGICVDVWNVSTGSRIFGPLGGHTGDVLTVTYTPDEHRIFSGLADKSIIVRGSTTGEILFGPLIRLFPSIRQDFRHRFIWQNDHHLECKDFPTHSQESPCAQRLADLSTVFTRWWIHYICFGRWDVESMGWEER